MIPKSGNRISDKITLKSERVDHDPLRLNRIMD